MASPFKALRALPDASLHPRRSAQERTVELQSRRPLQPISVRVPDRRSPKRQSRLRILTFHCLDAANCTFQPVAQPRLHEVAPVLVLQP